MSEKRLYLVSVSTGVPSAVAADICLRRFGHDAVELVFCDTGIEDGDNYRFMHECVKHWRKSVTTLKDGRTPLQVAEDEHIIPNQWLATCTEKLKFKLFKEYAAQRKAQGYDVVVVLGMDWKDRQKFITRGKYKGKRRPVPSVVEYAALGYKTYYPLIAKRTFVPDAEATVKAWGIEPPQMYRMGYTHANCGGCCVKQGAKDWRRTLVNFPDRFAEFEAWEQAQRETSGLAKYSFLRDETGGTRKNKTLAQLRVEVEQAQIEHARKLAIEAAKPKQHSLFDILDMYDELNGDICGVECGVAFAETA